MWNSNDFHYVVLDITYIYSIKILPAHMFFFKHVIVFFTVQETNSITPPKINVVMPYKYLKFTLLHYTVRYAKQFHQ